MVVLALDANHPLASRALFYGRFALTKETIVAHWISLRKSISPFGTEFAFISAPELHDEVNEIEHHSAHEKISDFLLSIRIATIKMIRERKPMSRIQETKSPKTSAPMNTIRPSATGSAG